ncbi:MAG: ferredoxin family protein [Candidatus Sumerlaeaceae bacterium]|nr:ferredoxin family protein [Candidatus Sumerlaeaceae bacterium]
MSHVVCEPCYDCKYTDCVVVCPMDCFYQDERMLYIDPVSCIDCGACTPECPVEAIFIDSDVPTRWQSFIALNLERTAAIKGCSGPLTEKQEPMEGAGCASRQKV